MSKHEEADLILKLYDLRREATMRKGARLVFSRPSIPSRWRTSTRRCSAEHSGYVRMVWTYWDMAAALVNHGSHQSRPVLRHQRRAHRRLSQAEPFLRLKYGANFGPNYLVNLER